MKKIYLLKDLSVKTGLSIYTIKYYLKLALIKEIGRSPDTNFRYFDDKTVKRLLKIRTLRKENLSLGEVKTILRRGEGGLVHRLVRRSLGEGGSPKVYRKSEGVGG